MGIYIHWMDLISIFIDQEGLNSFQNALRQWLPRNLLIRVVILEVWVGSHDIVYTPWNLFIYFVGFK